MWVFLKTIWKTDRKKFLQIQLLEILSSLTGSIGIVMLIPMLELLNVSAGSDSTLGKLFAPLAAFSYAGRAVFILLAFVLILLLKTLLNVVLSMRRQKFLESLDRQVRSRLYQAIMGAGWEQLTTMRSSDYMELLVNQCDQYGRGVTNTITLFGQMISALMQLAVACWMSVPVTGMVVLSGAAISVILLPYIRKTRACGNKTIQTSRRYFSELQDQFYSMKVSRVYGTKEENARRFETLSGEIFDVHMEYTRLNTASSTAYYAGAAFLVAVAFLFGVVFSHTGTAQMVVLIYIFSRLWPVLSNMQNMFQSLQACVPSYQAVAASCERLEASPVTPPAAVFMPPFCREITLEGVGFTYRGSSEPVLKDINISLPWGHITALIGHSGVGKSTLSDLLMGLLEPTTGRILVDGSLLCAEKMEAWRRQVGYVPQEAHVLNATLRENLTRFHPDATEEQMVAALRKAGAWDFVQHLEEGLDTMLGDRGIRLSGGQRQRLILARALMGNPRFLILDEATNSLDYENELAIRNMLSSFRGQITVLVISHRFSTICDADNVIVLEDGTVTEQGSMAELMQKTGSYLKRMLNAE